METSSITAQEHMLLLWDTFCFWMWIYFPYLCPCMACMAPWMPRFYLMWQFACSDIPRWKGENHLGLSLVNFPQHVTAIWTSLSVVEWFTISIETVLFCLLAIAADFCSLRLIQWLTVADSKPLIDCGWASVSESLFDFPFHPACVWTSFWFE